MFIETTVLGGDVVPGQRSEVSSDFVMSGTEALSQGEIDSMLRWDILNPSRRAQLTPGMEGVAELT